MYYVHIMIILFDTLWKKNLQNSNDVRIVQSLKFIFKIFCVYGTLW